MKSISQPENRDLPAELTAQLLEGSFLVASGTDELASIRERFARAHGETPLVITLTTTMDCNLGCCCCYEQRPAQQLRATDVSTIVETIREKLGAHFGLQEAHALDGLLVPGEDTQFGPG